jgi:hypothetical protein
MSKAFQAYAKYYDLRYQDKNCWTDRYQMNFLHAEKRLSGKQLGLAQG